MPHSREDLIHILRGLDPLERAGVLTMTLVELNHTDTKAAIHAMLSVCEQMSRCHSVATRFAISNNMRDCADRIERLAALV